MATHKQLKQKPRTSYVDVEFDKEGWIVDHQNDLKPILYDLVFVLIKREGEYRVIPAWWTGSYWYGRLLKEEDDVIKWRRRREDV